MQVRLRVSTWVLVAGTALAARPPRQTTSSCGGIEIAAQTATATTPFNQARVGAIVQLAVFEAVNAVTGDYEPYLQPGLVAPAGASVEAAVVVAAHDTLVAYFPAAAATLDASRDTDLALIPDGQAKTDGIALGMAAASAMIALRAADGSSPPTVFIPTSTATGDYQLTTGCAAGVFYHWQNVTPFGVSSAWDFLLPRRPTPEATATGRTTRRCRRSGAPGARRARRIVSRSSGSTPARRRASS